MQSVLILTAVPDAFFGLSDVMALERVVSIEGIPCYEHVMLEKKIVLHVCHIAQRGSLFAFIMQILFNHLHPSFVVVPGIFAFCFSLQKSRV
jgi:hypothetical protein